MFKFLTNFRKGDNPVNEGQRARFERLQTELNAMIEELPVRPNITVSGSTGRIEIAAPEQFQDEALALPKPDQMAEKPDDTAESAPEKEAA